MPAYNSGKYITEAIHSVLDQSYSNWELLIINDGSIDNTEDIIKEITDPRIHYFYKKNGGVSSARNLGLIKMKGDYFCFLDADDSYPKDSILSRINPFKNNCYLAFVDGSVQYKSFDFTSSLKLRKANYKGDPLPGLSGLNEACFFGNSWMIKNKKEYRYQFNEELTHGEDLFFYISIANQGLLDFTTEIVLNYRTGNDSAMVNLKGLEKGYKKIGLLMTQIPFVNQEHSKLYLKTSKLIMLKSYIGKCNPFGALRVLLNW